MILIVLVKLFSLNLLIEATDIQDLHILGCKTLVPPTGYDRVCEFEERVHVTATCKDHSLEKERKSVTFTLTYKNGASKTFNQTADITLDEESDGAILTCSITETFSGVFTKGDTIEKKSQVVFKTIVKKRSDNHEYADDKRNASNSNTLGYTTGGANYTFLVSASCAALVIVATTCYFICNALKRCTSKRPHNVLLHKDTTHATPHTVRETAGKKSRICEEYTQVIDNLDESEPSMYSEPLTVPEYAIPIPKCDRKKRKEDSYENLVNKDSKYVNVNVSPTSDYATAFDDVNRRKYDLDVYSEIYL